MVGRLHGKLSRYAGQSVYNVKCNETETFTDPRGAQRAATRPVRRVDG